MEEEQSQQQQQQQQHTEDLDQDQEYRRNPGTEVIPLSSTGESSEESDSEAAVEVVPTIVTSSSSSSPQYVPPSYFDWKVYYPFLQTLMDNLEILREDVDSISRVRAVLLIAS